MNSLAKFEKNQFISYDLKQIDKKIFFASETTPLCDIKLKKLNYCIAIDGDFILE